MSKTLWTATRPAASGALAFGLTRALACLPLPYLSVVESTLGLSYDGLAASVFALLSLLLVVDHLQNPRMVVHATLCLLSVWVMWDRVSSTVDRIYFGWIPLGLGIGFGSLLTRESDQLEEDEAEKSNPIHPRDIWIGASILLTARPDLADFSWVLPTAALLIVSWIYAPMNDTHMIWWDCGTRPTISGLLGLLLLFDFGLFSHITCIGVCCLERWWEFRMARQQHRRAHRHLASGCTIVALGLLVLASGMTAGWWHFAPADPLQRRWMASCQRMFASLGFASLGIKRSFKPSFKPCIISCRRLAAWACALLVLLPLVVVCLAARYKRPSE